MIYAFSMVVLAIPLAGGLWQELCDKDELYSCIEMVLIFGAAIAAGIVGWRETD